MFNFNETLKIKDTATAKGLELWEQINCENPDYSGFIEIQMQGGPTAKSSIRLSLLIIRKKRSKVTTAKQYVADFLVYVKFLR